jgi:hypothetical protein
MTSDRIEETVMGAKKSTKVPKAFEETYAAITKLTDDFCREHLNDDYAELARYATAALCRKRPSPLLAGGRRKTWACGILYALGQVNYLSDKASEPYLMMRDLAGLMGVGQGTAANKAKAIGTALGMSQFDADWTLPSLIDQHPLAWFIQVDGIMVDVRTMPVEIQEIAFEKGLIPYLTNEAP